MSMMDFHLYLIFMLERNYFGINIKNLIKLYRIRKGNAPVNYLISDNGEERILPVMNVKHALFLNDQKKTSMQKTEIGVCVPTLVEIESPIPDLHIHRMGIIVDFVIGLQQIPPDDFIDLESKETIQKENQILVNKACIIAHCNVPIVNTENHVLEVPVHLIHVENLFMYGVQSR